MSSQPDFVAYQKRMEEIKRRILAVDLVLNGKVTTSFQYTNMEFVALQFRMVFELIVLASSAAHRHLFEKMSRRLAKEWQIGPVVAEVRKRNPGFYPKPVRRVPSGKPGIKDDWLDTAGDFLKIDELIEAHGKLGSVLHARNPYLERDELVALQNNFPIWRQKVITLLDNHIIAFPDNETIMYVGMQSLEAGTVHTAFFKRKPHAQ
jgi:hypothetical protein